MYLHDIEFGYMPAKLVNAYPSNVLGIGRADKLLPHPSPSAVTIPHYGPGI